MLLTELAEIYARETEAYDAVVCTRRSRGVAVPRTEIERVKTCQHARQLNDQILDLLQRLRFTQGEWNSARNYAVRRLALELAQ